MATQCSVYNLIVGDTVRISASARDAYGKELSGRAIEWSSSDEAVASVNAEGMVTARAAASATIKASAEERGWECAPGPECHLVQRGYRAGEGIDHRAGHGDRTRGSDHQRD